MSSKEITRPLHELFARIYQTEKENLESQQKIRDVKKRINTIKMNINQLKQNMHEKDLEMAEQNYKTSLAQSQLNLLLARKKALVENLNKVTADYEAKVRERDELREQYNAKHNAYCDHVEDLAKLFQNQVINKARISGLNEEMNERELRR